MKDVPGNTVAPVYAAPATESRRPGTLLSLLESHRSYTLVFLPQLLQAGLFEPLLFVAVIMLSLSAPVAYDGNAPLRITGIWACLMTFRLQWGEHDERNCP